MPESKGGHDAVRAERREFSDWRPWLTRALVIAFAALAGLTIVGFTWLIDLAFATFQRIAAVGWWVPLRSLTGSGERIPEWRRRHPVVFAAGCGAAVALIALATDGATRGSGYEYKRGLLEDSHSAPIVYAFSKLLATWLSVWSGVPGGLFAPSLASAPASATTSP